ncbi:MAG: hypothetical protein ACOYEV_07820 [Candidatus Nanopelagicales bacterium]
MPRPLHYVLDRVESYQGIQKQLLDLIDTGMGAEVPQRGDYRPGALNFCLFIRPESDVIMSHGVADKNYFWAMDAAGKRMVNTKEHVLVPGKWLKSRMLNSPSITLSRDQIHVVGWPRLDELLAELRTPARTSGRAKPRILWAPTHNRRRRGEAARSTSSFPTFERYLRALARYTWVDVSVHPRNRTDHTPTGASLPRADVVIADFGTTVYEAWALGKPVIFPRWLLADRIADHLPGSAESYIFDKDIGYHPGSFDEMVDIIRAGPVITADVKSFMDEYLDPRYFGHASQRAAEVLKRLAGS